jgi:uncharacterized protein involved in type VI secretion and phage assembly
MSGTLFDFMGAEGERRDRVDGVAIGIVTNNQDPDKLGRVKLRFPWRESQDETGWVRVAALMAGSGRGSFFLPEVNDEVLVAFEQGDIRKPYVIGALWNGQDKPPADNSDGKNNIRKFTSRSGHELIFDDNSDQNKEKVQLHTSAGHTITLDDDPSAGKIQITSRAGHSVTLDDSSGAEKIEIRDKAGSNTIVIDSVQNSIQIQSGMQLKIKASQIEIAADAAMTIKAGATLTIQGALVQIN